MAGASDHDHHGTFGNPVPPEVRRLPHDATNSAPVTRGRFHYQDECITKDGLPELVSIKHREAHQTGDSGWSWNALKNRESCLTFIVSGATRVDHTLSTFWANAGFVASAWEIGKVLAENAEPSMKRIT
jgi:hypothetical protein